MSDGGKGSTPRPINVPVEQFNSNWDTIFGKKPEKAKEEQDVKIKFIHY